MSSLDPTRREALARELAGGRNRRGARVAAGLAAAGFHRDELSATFVALADEGRTRRSALRAADLEDTILAMLHLAAAGDPTSAAARREARAARLEAHRLNQQRHDLAPDLEPDQPMSREEWLATFAPPRSV